VVPTSILCVRSAFGGSFCVFIGSKLARQAVSRGRRGPARGSRRQDANMSSATIGPTMGLARLAGAGSFAGCRPERAAAGAGFGASNAAILVVCMSSMGTFCSGREAGGISPGVSRAPRVRDARDEALDHLALLAQVGLGRLQQRHLLVDGVVFSLILARLSRRDCSCALWSLICTSSGSITACTQRSVWTSRP
jgi:hypothetical protein